MRRVVLVHNPKAGDGRLDDDALVKLIRSAGWDVEYCSSKDNWPRALETAPDLIAVAGGDGTVGKVGREAAGRGVPIAILPLGTANNISTALGLVGRPLDELVAGWADAAAQPFDVGVARGPWGTFRFLESLGAGLLAQGMVEVKQGRVPHLGQIEEAAKRVEAARDLFQRQLTQSNAVRYALAVDGHDRSGDYLLVEALNFGTAGPNLRLAPQADPADGLLDVVVACEEDRRTLDDYFARLLLDPEHTPKLRVHRGRAVTLSCATCALHIDDGLWLEHAQGAEPAVIELSVEPRALTFLRPR
jgi:diacylglycerol kinase family enzyme